MEWWDYIEGPGKSQIEIRKNRSQRVGFLIGEQSIKKATVRGGGVTTDGHRLSFRRD